MPNVCAQINEGMTAITYGSNIKEAEAVVAEVMRRFNDSRLKKQSVGIVTFNIKQQKLICRIIVMLMYH